MSRPYPPLTDDGKKIGSFTVHRPPRRVLLLHVCLMLLAASLKNTLPWAAATDWIVWSALAAAVLPDYLSREQ